MNWGKTYARWRITYIVLCLAIPFVVATLGSLLHLNGNLYYGILFILAGFMSVALFIWLVFFWTLRCPKCRIGRGRSVNRNGEEFIVCRSCGHAEKTGWVFHSAG